MDYRMFKIKEQIIENLNQNWTVEKMAKLTNLSKDHFHKLFKKETKQTPIGFLRCERLKKAKDLLENTNKRVGEITAEVGINDLTHFARDFKKAFKFNPNEYRQKYWDNLQADTQKQPDIGSS